MRLLYLTPGCFDKGGISRYSRYQIVALRQLLGADNVRVLSLLGPSSEGFEAPFSVTWHGHSDRATTGNRFNFVFRTMRDAALWRPNIVLSAHVNLTPLLTVAGAVGGARTLLNVYGLEIWSGLSAWRKIHMARVDRIIADCQFTARYVSGEGLHECRPAVIWDPVDLVRFSPGPAERNILQKYRIPNPSKNFIVMSLGRLAKAAAHKGFDRLIRTVAVLAPSHPALRLVIAGRGDDRTRLEALAEECGITSRVIFTGAVEEEDLASLYRCAHVFSLVSDRDHGRGEGIPLTPLEAMACGVPIIVGNEDGSQEAVIGDRNGFIVSPRDSEQSERALHSLVTTPDLRLRMAAEARAVAQDLFGFERFVAQHRDVLQEVMSDIQALSSERLAETSRSPANGNGQ